MNRDGEYILGMTTVRSIHMVKRNTKYKSIKSPFLYFVFRPVTFVM